jgi:hypothetical protein
MGRQKPRSERRRKEFLMKAAVIDEFSGVPALRTTRASTGSKHTPAPSGSRTDARAKGRVANGGAPRRSEVSGDMDTTAESGERA